MGKSVKIELGRRGSGVYRKDTPYGLAQHLLLRGRRDATIVAELAAKHGVEEGKAKKIVWWCRGYLRRKGLL